MAYVDRNAQINKNLEFLMNYLMRTGIMGKEYENQRALNEQESENRMKYLGESQEGYTGLENLRSKNTMIERIGAGALTRGEKSAEHEDMMTRLREAWKNDVSKLPEIQSLQAIISKRILDGEDPASLKPLQDQMTDIQQKHAMSIMNSLKGAASTKDISDIMSLSDQTSRDIVGQIFQGMRQGREIEEIKKPEMGLRAGELGVSQAKQSLAEKTFAAEGGLTGQKLTDVEKGYMDMIQDAEQYLIGQGIKIDSYALRTGAAALKSPNPLEDPKVQGASLIILGQLRTKILKRQPLTDDDINWLQRAKSTAQINEEGLPSAVSGYKFPSELEGMAPGGAKGDIISGQPDKNGTPGKTTIVDPPGRPGTTWQYIGNNQWKKIRG
jgi:hypothetical protein